MTQNQAPVPRFFCGQAIAVGAYLTLPDALAHHVRVLRLEDGASITLFNGQGGQFEARLMLQGGRACAQVLRHCPFEAELHGRITLVQGLAGGDKMDWVVEKAVEMGVAVVQPIAAQRSVLRLSGNRLEKRLQHWQRIAQAASEQCGRNRLMTVPTVLTLEQYLSLRQHDTQQDALMLCCDPDAPDNLQDVLPTPRPHLIVLIGPEGGWSPQELDTARVHGAKCVRFGSRILRTETAGIALVSAITTLQSWQA